MAKNLRFEGLHPRSKVKGSEGEFADKLDVPDWLTRVSDQLIGTATGTKVAAKKATPAKKSTPAKKAAPSVPKPAKAAKAAARKAAPGFAEKLDAQALARSLASLDDAAWAAKLRAMDGPQRARVLDATTAPELKRRAKGVGLPVSGTKAALVERLDDHVQGKGLKAQQDARVRAATRDRVEADKAETRRQQDIASRAPGAKKAAPAKKATKAEVAEEQARQRQKVLDHVRGVARSLSAVDELVNDQASDRALRHRVEGFTRGYGLAEPIRDQLLAAVDRGDRPALLALADKLAREQGLTPIEAAGAPARMDRKRHEPMGADIDTGRPVVVARRGFVWKDPDGGEVLVARATVMHSDEAEYQRLVAERQSAPASDEVVPPAARGEEARYRAARAAGLSEPASIAFAHSGRSVDDLPSTPPASQTSGRRPARMRGPKPPEAPTAPVPEANARRRQQALDENLGARPDGSARPGGVAARSDAAIERQRRIDKVRPAGRIAAEMAELHTRLLDNQIPMDEAADTLAERIEGALAQVRGDRRADSQLPDGLDELADAARSRDVGRMQAAVAAMAAANGITLEGRSLDDVTLDRSKHTPLGIVADGERVVVMRPAVVFTDPQTGERIQLEKAIVAKVGPGELKAARARIVAGERARVAAARKADADRVRAEKSDAARIKAEAEAQERIATARALEPYLGSALDVAISARRDAKRAGQPDPGRLRRRLDELVSTEGQGLAPDEVALTRTLADDLGDLSKLDTPERLLRRVTTVLKARGIDMHGGTPGDLVPYDPETMDGGPDIQPGDEVEVFRPALRHTDPKTKAVTELSKVVVVRPPDPANAKADLDDRLFNLGRRKPKDTGPFDRAARAIARNEDPKAVAQQMRREALGDKSMSAEDRRTYELLAAELGKVDKRPPYIDENGNLDLDLLVGSEPSLDLSLLADPVIRPWATGQQHTYDRDKAKRWSITYEFVRNDLVKGTMTRAQAVKNLRKQIAVIQERVAAVQKKKDAWRVNHDRSPWSIQHFKPTDKEEADLKIGPATIQAYTELADLLARAKIPPRPRVATAPPTELGEVLPLDETPFRYVPLHDLVRSRGERLDPDFKHRGTGPAGGVTYLFGAGFQRPKRAGLTLAENDAVDRYTVGRVARDLNGSLRKGKNFHGVSSHPEIGLADIDLDDMRSDLDSAIANSELTEDAILWRGVGLKKADRDRLVPGAVFTETGYSSTAASDRGARKVLENWRASGNLPKGSTPVLFKILARAGTHGVVGHEQAYEVVLPRDQKFRVIREELDADGVTPVFVIEAIPPDTAGVSGFVRGRDLTGVFDAGDTPTSGLGLVDPTQIRRRIAEQQGFDGHPTVVSAEELDREIKRRGAVEMYRGVKASVDGRNGAAIIEQYRSGPMYYGATGGAIYGVGTYASTSRETAAKFARTHDAQRPGAVVRMALRRDARVIKYEDLRKLHLKAMPRAMRELEKQREAELASVDPTDTAKVQAIIAKYDDLRRKQPAKAQAVADFGNFAALLGYDAVIVPGGQGTRQTRGGGIDREDYYVILNRSAMLVEDTETAP